MARTCTSTAHTPCFAPPSAFPSRHWHVHRCSRVLHTPTAQDPSFAKTLPLLYKEERFLMLQGHHTPSIDAQRAVQQS